MSNQDLFRRQIGRFKISIDVIEQCPERIHLLLNRVIPIRAEYLYEDNCIHYTALCELFSSVKTGLAIPYYLPALKEGITTWERI